MTPNWSCLSTGVKVFDHFLNQGLGELKSCPNLGVPDRWQILGVAQVQNVHLMVQSNNKDTSAWITAVCDRLC